MTPLEIVAVVFTLANVWLAVKENIWTWPTGIVSVLLYLVVFWRTGLKLNAGLQVIYFVLSLHGWYEWLRGGVNKTELHVRVASARVWTLAMLAGVVLTGVLLFLLRITSTASSLPLADAVTTAFSLVGQWMLNVKIVENWLVWAAVDVIYVGMFFDEKLWATAALYGFFIVLSLKGYVDWRRTAATSR